MTGVRFSVLRHDTYVPKQLVGLNQRQFSFFLEFSNLFSSQSHNCQIYGKCIHICHEVWYKVFRGKGCTCIHEALISQKTKGYSLGEESTASCYCKKCNLKKSISSWCQFLIIASFCFIAFFGCILMYCLRLPACYLFYFFFLSKWDAILKGTEASLLN